MPGALTPCDGDKVRSARAHVLEVLDTWAEVAVEGHFRGHAAWMPYHELVRDSLAPAGIAAVM